MEKLKAQVRQLDHDQLVELRTYINGLMAIGGTRKVSPGEGLLLAVFEDSCRRFGLGFVPPPVKRLVLKREVSLNAFLATSCPGSAAVVKRSILATAIDLLYNDLLENGRIVNPRSLAYGLDRVPAILDRNFPAYAVCGLLPMIVTKVA